MQMGSGARKLALTAHIIASLGWIGAVAAFIALDVTTVTSDTSTTLRAAYIGMDLMTRWAIVPLAFASFASGLLMSLGTKWGLFRHWWVVITLLLTAIATIVLLVQVPVIDHRADMAADPTTSDLELASMGNLLPHSVGGTIVLLVITVLNVYKPRGLTRYGWRKQQQDAAQSSDAS
jgi:hypothetical protein